MTYKRHKTYYFVNKTTKGLDHLRVIDVFENGFMYLYKEEYKFCSFKNAEEKLYESDRNPELLAKLGKCRQSCYHGSTHSCTSLRCPCPVFIHVMDPAAIPKAFAKETKVEKAKEQREHTDLESYPYGDR